MKELLFVEKYSGLSEREVEKRIKEHGLNVIQLEKKGSLLKIFIHQFTSLFIIILIIAAGISYFLGEKLETLAILSIIVFNGILGFAQEYKASKAVEALREMDVTHAKVIRDGVIRKIDSARIVPGDIIVLEEGDKIPADGKIIQSKVWCNEAIITGESDAVERKEGDKIIANTNVIKGRAFAKVVKTGKNTEFGKIAKLTIETKKDKTPLEKDLEVFSKKLATIILLIIIVIFIFNSLRSADIMESLMFALSLAISAIPEGLPIVVTVTLSLGVLKMVKKNALVKRLLSVQSLGSVDVICSDKTGTITKNEITVKVVWMDGKEYTISGIGYKPYGDIFYENKKIVPSTHLLKLFEIASLCTTAEIEDVEKPVGDSTELSILYAGMKMGINKNKLKERFPIITMFTFDSELKRMSTVHNENGKYLVCVKGSVEGLLERSKNILYNGKYVRITEKIKKEIIEEMEQDARKSYRVLGVAMKSVEHGGSEFDREEIEKDLTFIGFMGMYDAPNDNVRESIQLCLESGIDVKMVTGDYKGTAVAIGKEIGLIGEYEEINEINITGEEIDELSDKELDERVMGIKIFSRVSPKQKLRILQSIKRNGKRVAMTGDGVNDAPALKYADVGISMGINGTDVTKESSDVILLDDNFSTIVEAIKEGRTIFNNIKKFIYYLLGSNFAEIIVIFNVLLVVALGLNSSANFIAMTVPLLPLQILWINLITDGLPAIALGNDPPSKGIMKQKNKDKILSMKEIKELILISIIIGLPSIYILLTQSNFEIIRTMLFNYLVFVQIIYVLSIRTSNFILSRELFSNKFLLLTILISGGLQFLILNYEPLSSIMRIAPLGMGEWKIIFGSILLVIGIIEILKCKRRGKMEIFK